MAHFCKHAHSLHTLVPCGRCVGHFGAVANGQFRCEGSSEASIMEA